MVKKQQYNYKCKYFIGLELNEFNKLYDFLGESVVNLNYWGAKGGKNQIQHMTLREQLIITLMRFTVDGT